MECGMCIDNEVCNKDTGVCPGICQNSFTGELCKGQLQSVY